MEETYFTASIIYFAAIVVFSGILLIVSFRYTRHAKAQAEQTRRMAEVLERDYIAKNTPVADFGFTGSSSSFEGIRVDLCISNWGAVSATLKEVRLLGSYRDDPSASCDLTFPNDLSLPPGRTVAHSITPSREQLIPNDDPKYQKLNVRQLPQNVDGEFRISYSDNRRATMYKEKKNPHW